MLNKIQEKVSFIESFSVHELLEVPVEKVSVAVSVSLSLLFFVHDIGLEQCSQSIDEDSNLWFFNHRINGSFDSAVTRGNITFIYKKVLIYKKLTLLIHKKVLIYKIYTP